MKTPFLALSAILLFAASAAAQHPPTNSTQRTEPAANPRECVAAGNSWQTCLGYPSNYSMTDSLNYSSPPLKLRSFPTLKESWKLRGPWEKTATDFFLDSYFNHTSRASLR